MDLSQTLEAFVREIGCDVWYYFSKIFSDFHFKAPVAVAASFYVGLLGGDWVLLTGFYLMVCIDLFFGSWAAVKLGTFTPTHFAKWVLKLVTYSICIVLIGFINAAMARVSGVAPPILNGFLGLMIVTEVLSVMANMHKIGLPVPALAVKLVTNIHAKTTASLEETTGGPLGEREKKEPHDQV